MSEQKTDNTYQVTSRYVYKAGPLNDLLEEFVVSVIKSISNSCKSARIFGSTALFIAKKMFGGKDQSYSYIQTEITDTETGTTYMCERDLDILTTSSHDVMNVLKMFGKLKQIKHIDCQYLYLLRNRGILTITRYRLEFLTNTCSHVIDKIFSRFIKKKYGQLFLNIDIVSCKKQSNSRSFPVQFLSKNFCTVWCAPTESFTFGELTCGNFHNFTQKCILDNYIESMVYHSIVYNPSAPPDHTPSGDRLKHCQTYQAVKDRLMLGDEDEFHQNLIPRLKYVLDGNDVALIKVREMKRCLPKTILNNPRKEKLHSEILEANCVFCCESLNTHRYVYITSCNHIVHVGCLAESLRRYYCSVMNASYRGTRTLPIEYDLEGNTILTDLGSKCSLCKVKLFDMKIPKVQNDTKQWIVNTEDDDIMPFV